jgi:hypothetical protein
MYYIAFILYNVIINSINYALFILAINMGLKRITLQILNINIKINYSV